MNVFKGLHKGTFTVHGDALLWNMSQAKTLFGELQNDQPITFGNNNATTAVSGN